MHIRPTTTQDVQQIMTIIGYAQQYLASLNIDQWQDGYPTQSQFEDDITNKESYVITNANAKVIATFMFSVAGEPSYKVIDGKWLTTVENYGVIHRIAVAEHYTNMGLARLIISHCEAQLKAKQITSMRIDTHQDNLGMQHILKTLDYTYCGVITLDSGALRLAYEKLM